MVYYKLKHSNYLDDLMRFEKDTNYIDFKTTIIKK